MNDKYITQRFAPTLTNHLMTLEPILSSTNQSTTLSQFVKRYGYAMDILDPSMYLKQKISPFGVMYNAIGKDISNLIYLDDRLKFPMVNSGNVTYVDIADLIVWTFFRILPINVRSEYHICKDAMGIPYIDQLEFTFKIPHGENINHHRHYRTGTIEFIKTNENLIVSKEGAIYDPSRNRFLQQYVSKTSDGYIRSAIFTPKSHTLEETARLTWRGWTEQYLPKCIEIHSTTGIEIETRIQHLHPVNQMIRNISTPTSREGIERVKSLLKKNSDYITRCKDNLISNGVEILS